ncbi:hypothetical protein AMR72_10015 [Flavobacterium psychrophilum]|nr:hypothetical protein AMR72_10015 [Flavobacterium psychrophilum]AOE52814.1 hypothetical protein ALW18_10005 [Flavobacterium psychrophilum]
MKLTSEQIIMIERYLNKDRIFYVDIKAEMVDHIAATLEAELNENDNFNLVLANYMNSHHKVKLLTAARHQEEMRDKQNRKFVLKQFFSLRGVVFFITVFGVAFLSTLNIWAYRFIEGTMMLLMLFILFGQKWLNSKYPFFKRLVDISQFYYLLPFLILTQVHRFTDETNFIHICKIVALSIGLTGYYLTYKSTPILQRNKYA